MTNAGFVDREEDAVVGRSIGGKYVVENVVGIGSMGAVYRARQPALDRTVAIKVMSTRLAAQPDFVQRFHREAKAASRLWHPNSVTVTDFGEESDGLLYLVMEYVPGRTLDRVVQDEFPLPMDRVVNIMVQVLSAVAAAHDLGVIHRDLKPENVLVSSGLDDDGSISDIVKVCDFGIAALAGDPDVLARRPEDHVASPSPPESHPGSQRRPSQKLTVAGTIVGTPAYMSPEQAQGLPPESSSDLYSVGAVLYELLTRRPPFDLEALDELLHAHLITTPADPRSIAPHVDANIAAVCLRALAKEPHARHPNARAMRAALRRAIDPHAYAAPSSGDTIGFTSPPPPVVETRAEPSEEPHPMTIRVNERPTEAPPPPPPSLTPLPPSPRRSTAAPPSAWVRHRWLAGPIGLVLAAALAGLFIRRTIEQRAMLESAALATSTSAAPAALAPSSSDNGPSSSAESSGARFSVPAAATAVDTPSSNASPSAAKTKASRNEPAVPSTRAKGPTTTGAAPEPAAAPVATTSLPPPAASTPPVAPTAAAPAVRPEPPAMPPPAAAYDASRARVIVAVSSVRNAARSSIVELVGHVSMTACYQTRLRALGRAEGGSGSMHLDIDEDGVVQSASVRLPPALAPASACFSAQLAKHRLTRPPDTGSATAELSLELIP